MAKTRHIQKRMNQRSIRQSMLKLVKSFGVNNGDKKVLNRKGCDAALGELEEVKKQLVKARERGGLVLVEKDEAWITTYALDSYSRTRRSRHQRESEHGYPHG